MSIDVEVRPEALRVVQLAYSKIADPRNWSKDGNQHEDRRCAIQWFDWAKNQLVPDLINQRDIEDRVHKIMDPLCDQEFNAGDIIDVNDNHGHWAICRIFRMTIKQLAE